MKVKVHESPLILMFGNSLYANHGMLIEASLVRVKGQRGGIGQPYLVTKTEPPLKHGPFASTPHISLH